MEFRWNKAFEAGLPTDKEIMANPRDNREWVVRDAQARVLTEIIEIFENSYNREIAEAKKALKKK